MNIDKNRMTEEIRRLKKEKNAVVLAHFYQDLGVQLLADRVGDSYDLSRYAKECEQEIIVFCGVRFMAESAKILNPSCRVLLPVRDAGCPMADMVTPEKILRMRREHPDAAVVCYVNSSAESKAVSDICCTSSNAVRVVASLPNREIIFVPDRNLGSYVAKAFPEKQFYYLYGFCPIHNRTTEEDVLLAKRLYPNAKVALHPECPEQTLRHADFIGSTKQILDYALLESEETIIGTENTIVDRLEYLDPTRKYHRLRDNFICENMRKTTVEHLYDALLEEKHEITLSRQLMDEAAASLEKMIKV